MKRDNYFATKRGPKPEPLDPELQMFADTQAFYRREFVRLRGQAGLISAKAFAAKRRELQVRAHQLALDVTAWMLRNGALVLIFTLLAAAVTGCAPFHFGKIGGDW